MLLTDPRLTASAIQFIQVWYFIKKKKNLQLSEPEKLSLKRIIYYQTSILEFICLQWLFSATR